MTSIANVQAAFAATLVDEWARAGVTDAVVSPGSRSTPMAVALEADRRLRLHVVLDERSAGFRALGMGLATGRPAVVLTTSGTAAVELHPAVVEAHHASVPMIAVTADRPPELHHVGAPQTVDQAQLYGSTVRWACHAGVPDGAAATTWRSLGARCVLEATGRRPGPVHLNLAFREPLLGDAGGVAGTPQGRPHGAPWHRRLPAVAPPPPQLVETLAAAGRPGLVVAGAGAGDGAAVHAAAAALGWPLLADPRSGARLPGGGTVAAADAVLRSARFACTHVPEVVLRLGAPWASRVVASWLARSGAEQVLVDPHGSWLDPDRTASAVVACDATDLCTALAAVAPRPGPPTWRREWADAERAAQAAIDSVLADHAEINEPGVARAVAAALPAGASLVVSSSMPVRDVEWFAAPRTGLRVLANRGANGIDGVMSTALGAAVSATGPTTVLLGDLAFLHDAGALAGAAASGADLTVVVVDNDGGGIFSFLPQARQLERPRFERLLGTPHGLDLARLATAQGIEVAVPAAMADVGPAVAEAVREGGLRMVLVRTDREANVRLHDDLHEAVVAAVDGLPSSAPSQ